MDPEADGYMGVSAQSEEKTSFQNKAAPNSPKLEGKGQGLAIIWCAWGCVWG